MPKFVRKTKEERMLEIRSAALEIFLLKGYTPTTMDNIVQAVNLSKGSVYRYYPSKEIILIDLLKDGVDINHDSIPNQYRKKTLSAEKISELLIDLLFSQAINDNYTKLYVILLYEKKFNKDLEKLYQETLNYGLNTLDRHINIGTLNQDKVIQVATIMSSFILGKFLLEEQFNLNINKKLLKKLFLDVINHE